MAGGGVLKRSSKMKRQGREVAGVQATICAKLVVRIGRGEKADLELYSDALSCVFLVLRFDSLMWCAWCVAPPCAWCVLPP